MQQDYLGVLIFYKVYVSVLKILTDHKDNSHTKI